MTEAMNKQDFLRRLKNPEFSKYHNLHAFHVRMHAGELSREDMQLWILNRFYYQQNIPIKDAIVLSKLPTQNDRKRWIQRILDHDGTEDSPGGIESWLRFGEAAGLSREHMLSKENILPGVRFAVDAYVNFCRQEPWLSAVASSLTELFAPDLMADRMKAIDMHYKWIAPEGVNYFRNRLGQAPRDAEHALELVLNHATTIEQQTAVLDALKFKCEVLWALLDSIEHVGLSAGREVCL